MKIEKVNENKIKISFDYSELEENNISVHSFLSNSYSTQKLFLAILDIANEEFGFNAKNCKISYETISFDNKEFLVIITKSTNSLDSNNLSPYNLLEICNKNNLLILYKKFYETLKNIQKDIIIRINNPIAQLKRLSWKTLGLPLLKMQSVRCQIRFF